MHLRLLLVVAVALTIFPLRADGARADGPAIPSLFVPVTSRPVTTTNDQAVVRSLPVTVQLDILPGAADGTRRVRLDLFGATFIADLSRGPAAAVSATSWLGGIEGVEGSFVSLTAEGDAVAGTISMPGALYRLSPAAGGVQLLEQLRQEAFPPDGPAIPVETTATGMDTDASISAGGPIIDVLVVYTSAARAASGGLAGIKATITEGIAEANTAYTNSRVIQRVRLVDTAEVAYAESGSGQTDLSRLRNPTDGYLDAVQGVRDQYGADLVILVTETLDECGRAYSMTVPGPRFATSAFSVVKRTCVTGQYSLAHEMGHNMGAGHDRVTGCIGAYPYACGYQDTVNRFRTVMAYDCAAPVSCTRVLYFSNPAVTYLGLPTGVADALPNSADNARTLNNTAAIVASFRPSIFGVALAFSATPAVATAGTGFTVQVAVRNSNGATVLADQATMVTLTVAAGPGSFFCDGAAAHTVANGIATFTNCRVSANGLYQLTATADLPMTPATSAAIVAGGFRLPVPLVASDTGVG